MTKEGGEAGGFTYNDQPETGSDSGSDSGGNGGRDGGGGGKQRRGRRRGRQRHDVVVDGRQWRR